MEEGLALEEELGDNETRGATVPLLKTACHSSSLFWTGYDMSLEAALLKREPRKGIVGIDLRTVPLVKGRSALVGGRTREVVLLRV